MISTLSPIIAASSSTESVSVTSRGNAVTASISRASSRCRLSRQGRAWPTKTSRAPAAASARASSSPSSVLPSTTSARRCRGSKAISRNCRSSSSCKAGVSGRAVTTALPAGSIPSARRTRPPRAHASARWATIEGPASAATMPRRQGSRSRKNGSLEWWSVVSASSVPPSGTSVQSRRSSRQRPQIWRGGYCAAPHAPQTWRANRPAAAIAASPWASRDRLPGGSAGIRVRARGSLRRGGGSSRVTARPARGLRPRRRAPCRS